MPRSSRFAELEKRIRQLEKHLLPHSFSALGIYNSQQLDKARGYRLLVHAEIEAYLEDRAREIVSEAFQFWKKYKKYRYVIISLLSHLGSILEKVDNELNSPQKKINMMDLDNRVNKVVTEYYRLLESNHGIRENNILLILLPLGINKRHIDNAWLGTIDTFGKNRGEIAHTSLSRQTQINPRDEMNTVEQLMRGLEKLDDQLNKIKQ